MSTDNTEEPALRENLLRLADRFKDNPDSISYRLRVERELPRDSFDIKLAVTAVLPVKDVKFDVTVSRILDVLNTFSVADWKIKNKGRSVDDTGAQRENLEASARVSLAEDYSLEQRARAASRAGIVLTEVQADYTVPVEVMDNNCAELRLEALRRINAEIAGMNRITGREWRIGSVEFEFSEQVFIVASKSGAQRVECKDVLTESTVAGRTNIDRVILIAQVELRSGK